MKLNRIDLSFFKDGSLKKCLRIMKLTSFFILVLTLQMSASVYSQTTTMSVKLKNSTLQELFLHIEKSSNYRFFYNNDEVDVNQRISIDAEEKTVGKILEAAFADLPYSFKELANKLILIERNGAKPNPMGATMQQQKSVSGKVTDSSGETLPGVSIVVKGTTIGAITDSNGNYSLSNVPENATLQFSFVGMKSQEFAVGGKTSINVTLVDEAIGIEEVVAIGYGTQRKVNLTGAVSTMNTNDLKDSPLTNLTAKLGGKLSGLISNTRSGEPGSDDAEIYIRGKATLGSTSPLIVIDGVPDRDGGIARLNPEDIESFTILKDATAAVYGARAANGVILVTTKRGSSGKAKVSFTSNYGISQPTRYPHMLNSFQYATSENEGLVLNGSPKRWTDNDLQLFKDGTDPLGHPNTNWFKEVMKPWSATENFLLSISGGSEKVKYFVSGQYENQDGVYTGGIAGYNQKQIRSNLDFSLTDNIKMSIDLLYRSQLKNSSSIARGSAPWGSVWDSRPYMVAKYPNGYYGLSVGGEPGNVLVWTLKDYNYVRNWDDYFQSKIAINWDLSKITKGLSAEGYVTYDLIKSQYKSFAATPPPAATWSAAKGYTIVNSQMQPSLGQSFTNSNRDLIFARLAYNKTIGLHAINAFIGYEQAYGYNEGITAIRYQFLSNSIDHIFAGSPVNPRNDSSVGESARSNLISRISYNFSDRYLLDLSGRYDGSQNFPKGKRFGFFPSVSAAWRISEESFFKSFAISNVLNQLKVRGSWGKTGNDAVSAYQYIQTYAFTTNGYAFGSTPTSNRAFALGPTPNTSITWEVATTTDLGLDAQLFKGKLDFSASIFRSERSRILVARSLSVPLYTGMTLPNQNIGEVLNKGIELEASYKGNTIGIGKNAFTYSISGNFTFVRNKVQFMDEPKNVPDYQKRTGFPIDSYMMYKSDGLFQNAAEVAAYPRLAGTVPGDIKYLDINDDKVINSLDQVRVFKSRTPEIIYGTTLACGYGNFQLSVFFQGQARAWGQLRPSGNNMIVDFFEGRWQKEGDNKYPLNFRSNSPSIVSSDLWLRSAAFIRLRNAEISYSIPKSISGNELGIRTYITASNLFSIDKFPSSIDVEAPNDAANSFYPIQRVINGGVTITF
jgi:TonB-dependent starch-binding outer membrane protein SusC